MGADLTVELGRLRVVTAATALEPAAQLLNDNLERALSVTLHDTCPRPVEKWESGPCGHVWCKTCGGGRAPACEWC